MIVQDVRLLLRENLQLQVRKFCEAKRLTQNEFAKQMGMSKATLSAYLSGQRFPRPEHMQSICSVLEIPVATLFAEK